MYEDLESINSRPEPFQFYTAEELWTDEHTSEEMLKYHLDETVDISSRRGAFIDSSVEWIASHFNVDSSTRIADFGCGPGLYTTRLARLGAQVTGIDFSKRSIAHARKSARKEGLDIRYVRENYLSYETDENFDLIIMIMCDYCALSPAQRSKLLLQFRNLLDPGGSILLDVYSYAAFDKKEEGASYEVKEMNGFWAKERYHCFLNTFNYEDVKVSLDKYTIITAERSRTIYYWLQYFSLEDLKKKFSDNGLRVAEQFGDVAGGEFSVGGDEFAVVGGLIDI